MDWALPVLTTNYTDVMAWLKERDRETATMFFDSTTSFASYPENTITFSRVSNSFYEKISGAWVNKVLSVWGGGTGSSDAGAARNNLGIGTMGTQNANNVNITGGSITGISTLGITGGITTGGNITAPNINATTGFYGNGYNITDIQAPQVKYGVLPDSVIPDPLPVRNGGLLYNLSPPALNSALGTAPVAALGSGPASIATFLRGDGTWASPPAAGGFPSGMMAMSPYACPPGWTRIGWDGQFLRVNSYHSGAGMGNPSTHAHNAGSYAGGAHTHPAGTLSTPSHNHGGSTGTVTIGFGISGSTNTVGNHNHSVGATTGGESAGQMNVDAGNSGNMSRAGHTHSFTATTSTDGNHAHTFSGSGSGSGTGSISNQASMGINGNTGSGGGGGITGFSNDVSHMPPFVDVYLCMKD